MGKVMGMIRENKGKSLLIAGIVLMWVLLLVLFKGYGYNQTWKLWGVPVEKRVFMDFRLIPGSAESFRRGFEPSVENPKDPNGRIFNYPAFWRLFFYTNINLDDTIWIVVLMLILYFAGVILFPQKITIPDALLMLLVVFSPASMLLYERGNADLFVFFICAITVLATEHSANLTAILIVFGAIVKMFPLFGITVLLKEPKQKFWGLAIACVLFMVVYGLLTFQSQSAAWNTTMRGDGLSYGTFVIITRLGKYFQQSLPDLFSITQWQLLFEILALVLILFPGILAVREPAPLTESQERNLTAFRMGASIYLGTFLLGNNWDYRLAFLVLVIPQLSQWFYLGNKKHRVIAIGVMVAMLLSCWNMILRFDLSFISLKDPANRNFVIDEFINWLLVPGFAYLLAASFPEWLKVDLQKRLGKAKSKSVGA
jgi:hypothetical protein